jgi:hypothetical protein
MTRKINVSIQADIDCVPTEEEEKIIKQIEDLDYTSEEYDDLYDELTNKLRDMVTARLMNKDNYTFFDVCDVIW